MSPERLLDPNRLVDHVDRLYRAAWAMCGSREQAEDLVQETFARVLGRRRLLSRDDDLGYLLRALRNTFLTQRRDASRRPQTEPFDADFGDRAPAPPQVVEAREVYAAIAALPASCRDALVAVDVLGLSYREAARALRTREGTITSRLYRARQEVASRLRVDEGDSSAVEVGTPRREVPRLPASWRARAGSLG